MMTNRTYSVKLVLRDLAGTCFDARICANLMCEIELPFAAVAVAPVWRCVAETNCCSCQAPLGRSEETDRSSVGSPASPGEHNEHREWRDRVYIINLK